MAILNRERAPIWELALLLLSLTMNDSRDNEYHNPRALGSLSGALRIWQTVGAAHREDSPHHFVFAFRCRSESRAGRVAGFLQRRLACAMTRVSRGVGADRQAWHVHGSTRREIQSLRSLEQLSTWLREAASSHQVDLIRFSLVSIMRPDFRCS